MNTIIFSHYTVKGINPEPWQKTWQNLVAFAEKMSPRFQALGIKFKLRKVILEEITQESLMTGNMVTLSGGDFNAEEKNIENFTLMQTDYEPCEGFVTPDGVPFPARVAVDFEGKRNVILTENIFLEAALKLAFKAQCSESCEGVQCESCLNGCHEDMDVDSAEECSATSEFDVKTRI